MDCDVAIVGGGPAGSTLATYLRKHAPSLDVRLFERERFPRDHVGESQLPIISRYLDEMGVWDAVEAAGFPIKIGATYKWGQSKELWDFDFIEGGGLTDEPRPAQYKGQRQFTAFQVDRAVYDKILLDHAEALGTHVRQETRIARVLREEDRVTGLVLDGGETVTARFYADASGHAGILRRAMGVQTQSPTSLQNIAVWDYWLNADWAENIGIGGTRVQVMSLPYGWIWFIPLGPTRTSVGLICPAAHYRTTGLKPENLYRRALEEEPRIAHLLQNAECEGKIGTTKDWSFLAERLYGENWFLVGESAGFADPILAAGMSIAHAGAREAAFTIMELDRGKLDSRWLLDEYQRLQVNRIRNHIRFADYWYSANAQFGDLKGFTREIAEANGLDLSPDKAWQWLAQGGFIDDDLTAGTATLSLTAIKGLGKYMTPMDAGSPLDENNVFHLNLVGANFGYRAAYEDGGVRRYDAYERDGKLLPLVGVFEVIVDILQRDPTLPGILGQIRALTEGNQGNADFKIWILDRIPVALEALIAGGWVVASHDPRFPLAKTNRDVLVMHWHTDADKTLREIAMR